MLLRQKGIVFNYLVGKIGSDDVLSKWRHTGRYGDDKSLRE
jgi:hypothetical protein